MYYDVQYTKPNKFSYSEVRCILLRQTLTLYFPFSMCLYVYNACNCHPIQHQTSFYTVCITAMLTTFYRYHFSDTNAYHCKNICTTDPHHLNYGHRTFPFSDIHTLIVLLLIMQGHCCKEEAGGGEGAKGPIPPFIQHFLSMYNCT